MLEDRAGVDDRAIKIVVWRDGDRVFRPMPKFSPTPARAVKSALARSFARKMQMPRVRATCAGHKFSGQRNQRYRVEFVHVREQWSSVDSHEVQTREMAPAERLVPQGLHQRRAALGHAVHEHVPGRGRIDIDGRANILALDRVGVDVKLRTLRKLGSELGRPNRGALPIVAAIRGPHCGRRGGEEAEPQRQLPKWEHGTKAPGGPRSRGNSIVRCLEPAMNQMTGNGGRWRRGGSNLAPGPRARSAVDLRQVRLLLDLRPMRAPARPAGGRGGAGG